MTPHDREQFVADVVTALQAGPVLLTDEERHWVRLAIKREAQSFELRKAIIEKTLAGLAWSVLVMLGYLIVEYLRSKGLKI